ncbi:glycosyltransferase [Candidatus Woesearchaeota archaeon]|nr:glycosyltransferase [Candidatus Woesearchaeota archaeon]
MKIGVVSKFPEEKDGIAIYSENLCREMKNVVRIGDISSTKADYRINFRSLGLGKRLAEIAEKEKLDILHVQHIAAGEFFGKYTLNMPVILALRQKVPVVVTLHEVHYKCTGPRQKIICAIQKAIVKKASAIIVHTPLQADFLNRKYRTGKAECIYHGLKKTERRARKGKGILFFGMINSGKGVEYLIEAMKELPGYRLRIVGKPINRDYAEKIRRAAGRAKNAEVKLGWVSEEEKKRELSKASIMVLPYVWAPYQSGVAANAVSYGIPMVVTKAGWNWEMVEKFRCGEVVEARNAGAIAAGVRKIEGRYGDYIKGINRYRKEADWAEVAKKHVKIYRKILER